MFPISYDIRAYIDPYHEVDANPKYPCTRKSKRGKSLRRIADYKSVSKIRCKHWSIHYFSSFIMLSIERLVYCCVGKENEYIYYITLHIWLILRLIWGSFWRANGLTTWPNNQLISCCQQCWSVGVHMLSLRGLSLFIGMGGYDFGGGGHDFFSHPVGGVMTFSLIR